MLRALSLQYCTLVFLLAAAAAVGGGVAYVNNKEVSLLHCKFIKAASVYWSSCSYFIQFSGHVAEFYATIYTQYLVTGDVIRAFILKLFHNAVCDMNTNTYAQ